MQINCHNMSKTIKILQEINLDIPKHLLYNNKRIGDIKWIIEN